MTQRMVAFAVLALRDQAAGQRRPRVHIPIPTADRHGDLLRQLSRPPDPPQAATRRVAVPPLPHADG